MMRGFRFLLTVKMNMPVLMSVVVVCVGVDFLSREDLPDRVYAEKRQHYPDKSFKNAFGVFRDLDLYEDHQRTNQKERDRVPDAPKSADDRRRKDILVLAHDRRNSREMVCLDRVVQSENKTDQEYGDCRLF